jgi:hypothetical protein
VFQAEARGSAPPGSQGLLYRVPSWLNLMFLRAWDFCEGETKSRQIWLARGRRTNNCVNASIEWPSAETE